MSKPLLPEIRAVKTEPVTENIDVEKATVTYLISPVTPDSYRTLFQHDGWELERYRKAPIFIWNHRSWGSVDDALGTVVELNITKQGLFGKARYAVESSETARKVFDLVVDGTLRGVSHRFKPLDWVWADDEERVSELHPYARRAIKSGAVDLVYTRMELQEVSKVLLGSNADALARSLRDGLIPEELLTRSLDPSEFAQIKRLAERKVTPVEFDPKKFEEAQQSRFRALETQMNRLEEKLDKALERTGEATGEITVPINVDVKLGDEDGPTSDERSEAPDFETMSLEDLNAFF